jgi:hypothetical protein
MEDNGFAVMALLLADQQTGERDQADRCRSMYVRSRRLVIKLNKKSGGSCTAQLGEFSPKGRNVYVQHLVTGMHDMTPGLAASALTLMPISHASAVGIAAKPIWELPQHAWSAT